jgi:hypothetical protein
MLTAADRLTYSKLLGASHDISPEGNCADSGLKSSLGARFCLRGTSETNGPTKRLHRGQCSVMACGPRILTVSPQAGQFM